MADQWVQLQHPDFPKEDQRITVAPHQVEHYKTLGFKPVPKSKTAEKE